MSGCLSCHDRPGSRSFRCRCFPLFLPATAAPHCRTHLISRGPVHDAPSSLATDQPGNPEPFHPPGSRPMAAESFGRLLQFLLFRRPPLQCGPVYAELHFTSTLAGFARESFGRTGPPARQKPASAGPWRRSPEVNQPVFRSHVRVEDIVVLARQLGQEYGDGVIADIRRSGEVRSQSGAC